MRKSLISVATTFLSVILCSAQGQAQVLAPMKDEVNSFAEKFVVKVFIKNPYKTPQTSYLSVYDENWMIIDTAILTRRTAYLAAGHSANVTALVPFNGSVKRKIYICHTIVPKLNGRGASYKGEVCGKYTATRHYI